MNPFNQVNKNSVDYATNVYIIDGEGTQHQVFGDTNWIKSDIYSDNQKVKDVLNQKLKDSEYSDFYYAVNVKTITVEPHLDQNYYVLKGTYGANGRENDLDINPNTGFVQKIYFTMVSKRNHGIQDTFKVKNEQGKDKDVKYRIQYKNYFKMTEIEE